MCGCVAAGQLRFVEIDDQQKGLCGQELKPAEPFLVLPLQIERAQRASLLERRAAEGEHVALAFEVGRAALLQILLQPLQPALGHAEVGEDQLVFHRLSIARRIDRPRGVGNGRIAERPQHMNKRVRVLVRHHIDECLRAARRAHRRQV